MKEFKNPDIKYSPYTFFFLNDEFEIPHMLEMQKKIEKKGMSIGYLQDRGITKNKFLTDGYFKTVKALAENASIPFGLCDEIGGMYGASCLEYDIPRAVSLSERKEKIQSGYIVPKCFFAVSFKRENGLIKTDSMRLLQIGDAENENTDIYIFEKYHARSRSGSDIDYLNPKTAEIITENVYEKIKDNLSEFFGNKISGMFMDIEGDFGYKNAYSERLAEKYSELYGEDIHLLMPLLYEEDTECKWREARYRYFEAVSFVYSEFFGKISEWCRKNGLEFTGHTWEENLYGQVMQEGDFYRIEKNFSIIGTDSLRLECYSMREFAEARTVSHFENKRLMCETIGCSGNALSALEIKRAVSCMTAWGVSHIIFHGIYSNRSIEKMGFMPDMFDNNTYWDGFSKISDFIKRISYITDSTKICADTVVLNPIDSVKSFLGDYAFESDKDFSGYIIEQRDMLKCSRGLEIKEIEESYSRVIEELVRRHTEFLVYDTVYLNTADFEGIKNIIVPSMPVISKEVLLRLKSLSERGINIRFVGRTPLFSIENDGDDLRDILSSIKNAYSELNISPGISLENKAFDFISSHRVSGNRHYFWIYNNTSEKQHGKFKFGGIKGAARKLNCENGEIIPLYTDGNLIYADFEPYEAFYIEIAEEKAVIPDKWNITIGEKSIEDDYLKDWKEYGISDYSGFAVYETDVMIDDISNVRMEIDEAYHVIKAYVNNEYIDIRLWQPYSFDITDYVKRGINKIRIECGNLYSASLLHYKNKTRWQTGIHRSNPIDSCRSGIYGKVKFVCR